MRFDRFSRSTKVYLMDMHLCEIVRVTFFRKSYCSILVRVIVIMDHIAFVFMVLLRRKIIKLIE